jgi:hypothetical protein
MLYCIGFQLVVLVLINFLLSKRLCYNGASDISEAKSEARRPCATLAVGCRSALNWHLY